MIKSGYLELDEIDYKILKELSKNSRRSSRDIARRLDLSVATVASRIKRLVETGVIKGFTIDLDAEKLGYDITVVMEVYVAKGKLLEVEREIAKLPGVCAVYDVTGEYDALVVARFRSRSELSNFTKKLLSMNNVERTNTHVVLNIIKENFKLI